MATNPERAVGVILALNISPYGNEYTAEGVRASVGVVKGLLDDTSLKARYLDFDVVFDLATIPKQRKRPGKHLVWVMVSEEISDGKLRAWATKSELWVRQAVCNVPFTHYKDYVNPLGVGRGLVNPQQGFFAVGKAQAMAHGMEGGQSHP